MYRMDLCEVDGRRVFPIIFTNKRDRILSYYQTDEIKDVLHQIDVSKPNGIRDKCMLLLVAQTGLRSSDILGLLLTIQTPPIKMIVIAFHKSTFIRFFNFNVCNIANVAFVHATTSS